MNGTPCLPIICQSFQRSRRDGPCCSTCDWKPCRTLNGGTPPGVINVYVFFIIHFGSQSAKCLYRSVQYDAQRIALSEPARMGNRRAKGWKLPGIWPGYHGFDSSGASISLGHLVRKCASRVAGHFPPCTETNYAEIINEWSLRICPSMRFPGSGSDRILIEFPFLSCCHMKRTGRKDTSYWSENKSPGHETRLVLPEATKEAN